jgi:hypothetical protein
VEELIDRPDIRREFAARALEEARLHYSSAAMVKAVIATYEDALRESRG